MKQERLTKDMAFILRKIAALYLKLSILECFYQQQHKSLSILISVLKENSPNSFFFVRLVRTYENFFRFSDIEAIRGLLNSSWSHIVNGTEYPDWILVNSRQHVLLQRVTQLNVQILLSLLNEVDDLIENQCLAQGSCHFLQDYLFGKQLGCTYNYCLCCPWPCIGSR